MRDIVIYDACVFIDVINMGILEALSKAGAIIHTTSLVTNEILLPVQKNAIGKWLNIQVLRYDTIDQYDELNKFRSTIYPQKNLSLPDFSVLKLAIDMAVPLYTSDSGLRKVAQIHGVQVHGSLGLVIELYRCGALSKVEAQVAIDKLQETNSRISKRVIEEALYELGFMKAK